MPQPSGFYGATSFLNLADIVSWFSWWFLLIVLIKPQKASQEFLSYRVIWFIWWTSYHFYKLNLVFKLCLKYGERPFEHVPAKSGPTLVSILLHSSVTKLWFHVKVAILQLKDHLPTSRRCAARRGESYDLVSGQQCENHVWCGTSGVPPLLKRGKVPISTPFLTPFCYLECWYDGWSSGSHMEAIHWRWWDRNTGDWSLEDTMELPNPLGCFSDCKWKKLLSCLYCHHLEVFRYVQTQSELCALNVFWKNIDFFKVRKLTSC